MAACLLGRKLSATPTRRRKRDLAPVHHGRYDSAMDTERGHLRSVEAGERLPEPADDLEFLDDSAAVNVAGLRQELHDPRHE